jgi:hypothetical protein
MPLRAEVFEFAWCSLSASTLGHQYNKIQRLRGCKVCDCPPEFAWVGVSVGVKSLNTCNGFEDCCRSSPSSTGVHPSNQQSNDQRAQLEQVKGVQHCSRGFSRTLRKQIIG